MNSVMINGRFPGQSPRSWEEDFEGMQEFYDTCLLGAYAVCREYSAVSTRRPSEPRVTC